MHAERWQEIERLYHRAQSMDRGARTAFLSVACGGDEELRLEIESLLAHEPLTVELLSRAEPGTLRSPGPSVGPYQILGPLGSGGMGQVYRALDTRLNRRVAIKFLDQEFIGRFDREARAAAALNHPNICVLHDIGPDYLVMELLEGETLEAQISKGALSLPSIFRYSSQIAEALDCAHRAGIIHRDLKPSNIMLTANGVKVMDFGLAKFAQADSQDGNLTGGRVVGTPAYMSPEQALGRDVTPAADLFSFAVVMYEMATAKRPFERANAFATIDAVIHEEPVPVCDVSPPVPQSLGRIIAKGLAKEPSARYGSAAEMLTDLRLAEAGVDAAGVTRRPAGKLSGKMRR